MFLRLLHLQGQLKKSAYPADGNNKFLLNADTYIPIYMASYLGRMAS
jgi:hypothetical protein